MSRIVLVGNGVTSTNHELGKVIDSYDTVVRFNWYVTEGKEKYVGSKTDIWVTSIYDPVRSKKAFKNKTNIILHNYVWSNQNCKLFKKLSEDRDQWGKRYGRADPSKIVRTFEKLIYDIMAYGRTREGVVKSVQKPSNDAYMFSSYSMAAWWFAMTKHENYKATCRQRQDLDFFPECDKIDMYGFDWWDWGKEHWSLDDSPESLKKHNPAAEIRLFTGLFEDKRMKDLNPDSDFHKYYE